MRVRTQLALTLAALAGFTAALIVVVAAVGARNILFQRIQSQVLTIAATAATQVEADRHERLRTVADEAGPDYAVIRDRLRAIRDANRRADVQVRFVYTMRPRADGRWEYVVDAEEPGPDRSALGDPVETDDRQPLRTDAPYAEDRFSQDSFGTWLSANAPIRDAAGRTVGLVSADFEAGLVEAQLDRLLVACVVAGALALGLGIVGGMLVARWFTRPLEEIGSAVARIGHGEFDVRVRADRRDEFGTLAAAVNQMGAALRERDALKSALVRYVSREVTEEILAGEGRVISGARKQITVLILDIRNFTAMSAQLEPELVVTFLNRFFTRMIEIIFAHRGTLDKFLGDGCLAIFGAPLDDADHRRSALRVAREMLAATEELGADLAQRGLPLRIGIGLHAGDAIVGDIGSEQRTEYTAIGDTVNVASRLEALTKEYGVPVLASESVVSGAGEEFTFREVAEVAPRGTTQPLKIFTFSDEP